MVPNADLHTIAARMQEKFEKTKKNADNFMAVSGRNLFPATISSGAVLRTVTLIYRLVCELEARGNTIRTGEHGLEIVVDGEVMKIALTEKTDRVPHTPTEKEEAALRRWEAERDRKQKRGEYILDWDKPRIPAWDHVPNGKLTLTINDGYHADGLRRRFSDGKSRGLQDMLDGIIEGFATLAAAEKTKRADEERRRMEWAEQEKRRKEIRAAGCSATKTA